VKRDSRTLYWLPWSPRSSLSPETYVDSD
jgi:hypothetical protein